jgi:hypothetical protein
MFKKKDKNSIDGWVPKMQKTEKGKKINNYKEGKDVEKFK